MSDPPSLEVIRAAVRQRIEETSIRRAAAEIGCSASGLHRFASEGGDVYRESLLRLRRWYAKRSGRAVQAEPTAADATRTALVHMGRILIPAGIMESSEASFVDDDETPEAAREREAELLRRFVSGTDAERAEGFLAIYSRFRFTVREEMERAGLAAEEAEQRVGAVFGRTLAALRERGPTEESRALREHLMEAAHCMAGDPNWRPSR